MFGANMPHIATSVKEFQLYRISSRFNPIFQPAGWNKTFAEMMPEEKNEISMRKIAFQKLKEYLKKLL